MSYVCGKDHPQYKHGMKNTPEWWAWVEMRRRCENPARSAYKNYGARGIKVCESWNSFQNFIDDMGPRPSPSHSLDRIDNNGDYTPSNCRWATSQEQLNNTRVNRLIVYRGQSISLSSALRIAESGVTRTMAKYRLARGWPVDAALDTPRQRKLAARWQKAPSP